MKYITFAIPSYNSQDYLNRAVDSLLPGGEDVEILIINDGSSDRTGEIADDYERRFPSIVRSIHKPNGGHGSGVNRGAAEAKGLFYKVIDSDDWVDPKALLQLLQVVKEHVEKGIEADLYLTNFIYDHLDAGNNHVRRWAKQFPENRFFEWGDIGTFRGAECILMHSILYKTSRLRESGTVLPEHTFYVDNIYAYKPLPYMKKLYYLNVDLYHYFIGRDDQSVNINNFVKRYDQQIRVMNCMLEAYTYDEINQMPDAQRSYMLHDLSAIMCNTLMFCGIVDDEDRRRAYAKLWEDLYQRDPKLYNYLRHRSIPALVCWMPWKARAQVLLLSYRILCKTVKLGTEVKLSAPVRS